MATKLTLSIDEATVKRAKALSRKKGKSISKMVEEYFDALSKKEEQEEPVAGKIGKIMEPYRDKLQLPESMSYKEMIAKWRYEDQVNEDGEQYKTRNKRKKK